MFYGFIKRDHEYIWLSNRKMSSPLSFELFKDSKDPERKHYIYYISVKTQYAGIENHRFIIHIFKHLQEKGYLKPLNIQDEGEYWETGDEDRLKENFKRYSDLIDSFGLAPKWQAGCTTAWFDYAHHK